MSDSCQDDLVQLLAEVRACQVCREQLPFDPRPVLRASSSARLLIVGQAPGTQVHQSGIPWKDASGDRLRQWLHMDQATFYDESRIAIVPIGFCYPGRDRRGGDLPPRPECAPLWHAQLLARMPAIRLRLLVGHYAQLYYLGDRCKKNMTETVRAFRQYLPDYLPTPHPSWRNTLWQRKNPWFQGEVLPELRTRIRTLLKTPTG